MGFDVAVRGILFDYGKVLSLPPTPEDWAALRAIFRASEARFEQLYWEFRDLYDLNELSGPEYWLHVAQRTDVVLTSAAIDRQIELDNRQWTRINPEMLAFARKAKASGMAIGILSNMQRDMLAAMRRQLNWLSEFDAQLFTCEMGVVKPAKESYLRAVEAMGTAPAETLFLDDKMKNVEGARRAGLQALLFEGDRKAVDDYLAALNLHK